MGRAVEVTSEHQVTRANESDVPALAGFCVLLSLLYGLGIGFAQTHEHREHGREDNATVHHRFEDAEVWAARFENPERDSWQLPEKVVSALVTRQDMVVADIGSATGYFPVRFARACPLGMVIGADIEPDMVFI